MKKVLFFGDSITDCGRNRNWDVETGNGYVTLIKADLSYEFPNQFEFINRGISGNRIVDLLARVKSDCINLCPDYISILIGVNDVWHEIESNNGVDSDDFEIIYDLLIRRIKTDLPNAGILLIEPFVFTGSATCNTEDYPNHFETFKNGVEKNVIITGKIASKYNLPLIKLQEQFNKLLNKAPSDVWLMDGVHPTAAGHRMIANEWINSFKNIEKQ